MNIASRSILSFAACCALAAQETRTGRFEVRVDGGAAGVMVGDGHGAFPGTVEFLSSEMAFSGRLVKNAPYSADAVTETSQSLVDGNRISRKTTTTLHRDSEGRTRREMSVAGVGPFTAGEPHETVFIDDPVSGVNWVLEPRTRSARKMSVRKFDRVLRPGDNKVEEEMKAKVGARAFAFAVPSEAVRVEMGPGGGVLHPGGAGVMQWTARDGGDGAAGTMQFKNESLGKRMIEGVEATGTRTVTTIPAGAIGNERPIEIISERWYSDELQTIVMSRRSDPRVGETIYRLSNLRRTEPLRSLFEPPPDYNVKEGPGIEVEKMRRSIEELRSRKHEEI